MNEIVVSVPPAASFLSVGLPLKISLTLDNRKVMYGSTLLGWKDHAWFYRPSPGTLLDRYPSAPARRYMVEWHEPDIRGRDPFF